MRVKDLCTLTKIRVIFYIKKKKQIYILKMLKEKQFIRVGLLSRVGKAFKTSARVCVCARIYL